MLVSVSVLDSGRDHNPKRRKEMKNVRFNYWKLTAVVAILAITLIGLSGLLSMTTIAQEQKETIEKVTAPDREIDLRAKLKDKKFTDGRRVVIETLASGEKLVAEVKGGKFVKVFLVATDGTEVQGVVKKKTKDTQTSTCTMTITQTTTTHRLIRKDVVTTQNTIVPIPCPLSLNGDTFFK